MSEKKICPFPFSRIELGSRHNGFVPCCYAWFNDDYYALEPDIKNFENRYEEIWNSEQAVELRKSILEGNYKYCKLDRCNKPQVKISELDYLDLEGYETPIGDKNLEALKNNDPTLTEGPSSISICADLKCNLKCPSCRNDYIVKNTPERQEMIDSELRYIEANKDTIETIKMSSGGEVLFSKDQRKLLKSLNLFDYPKLDHVFIITNGLLLTPKTFDDLFPGSSFIKKITISIDAGDEATYAVTRGGDWKQLIKNLEWISEQRKKGELYTISMNFVLRKANYKSIDKLVELARRLQFDYIEFVEFDNWNDLYDLHLDIAAEFEDQAIHLASHPEHSELLDILRPYRNSKDIRINIHGLNFNSGKA